MHEHNNSLWNDEHESSSSNDSNEDTINVVGDEQYNLFSFDKAKEIENLMDNGFENFVKKEGPNQIMHLILEEQINNMHFGEVFDSNNFKDWMKRVA